MAPQAPTKPDDKPTEKPAAKAEPKTASAADVNDALAAGTTPADLEADAKFYCPGCGRRHDTAGDCIGTPTAPHAPIAVVSTKELAGDTDKHTAAPNTEG